MWFLIVDETDSDVEDSVTKAKEEFLPVLGIVAKNWHVYGDTGNHIWDIILGYDATHLFNVRYTAVFINWSRSKRNTPESHDEMARKWLNWAERGGAIFRRTKLLSISTYPPASRIKKIGDSVEDMIRMMCRLSGRRTST